jgi:hypothetical protein
MGMKSRQTGINVVSQEKEREIERAKMNSQEKKIALIERQRSEK